MTHPQIVKKLIGNINPIGQSSIDDERYENLNVIIDLMYNLLSDIQSVAHNNENSYEYSVKRAGETARDFLNNIKEEL